MAHKPRPMDGPGANGLRGGRGAYPSGKTAIGVWLDSKGGPSGYKRGFHSSDFETEGQHAQKGFGGSGKDELFGSELPNPEHLHRKPPKAGDLFNPLYSGTPKLDYMTNATTQFADVGKKVSHPCRRQTAFRLRTDHHHLKMALTSLLLHLIFI